MEPLPPSGVWRGITTRVYLSCQGGAPPLEPKPISAVLFFDENSVSGHAIVDGLSMTIAGWWGSVARMRPLVRELAETELWEKGEAALSFLLRDGSKDESCHAWIRDGEISGYRRYEGA